MKYKAALESFKGSRGTFDIKTGVFYIHQSRTDNEWEISQVGEDFVIVMCEARLEPQSVWVPFERFVLRLNRK